MYTAQMPPPTDIIIFKNPAKILPFCSKQRESALNAENVVNPPKNPIIMPRAQISEITVASTDPMIIPIKSEPIRFTKIVPTGNPTSISAQDR